MKKVLIIGGTGTISLPITKKLAEDKNIEVYVLNRGTKNTLLPQGVKYMKGNIQEVEEMKQLMSNHCFDCVINFIVWNYIDALHNVEVFQEKTKQFIYISTVCVLNHEITCNIDEQCELENSYSDYGQEKAAAEKVFLNARDEIGFPITIVRPTQTYSEQRIPLSVKGNGCWPVINRMLRGKKVIIHGDGQSIWASTHANDFAKGFTKLVTDKSTIGEIYQIMNPEPHTWDMIYQTLAQLLNVDYKPIYIGTDILKTSKKYNFMGSIQGDKRWSNIFNISKLKSKNMEFQCEIDYKKGLEMYLEFMNTHPEMKIEEPEFDQWCDNTIALYEETIAQLDGKL